MLKGWLNKTVLPVVATPIGAGSKTTFAGDVCARATVDAVQILGGYGFVNDYPVEKLMRDARGFDAVIGDERLDRALAIKATFGAEK